MRRGRILINIGIPCLLYRVRHQRCDNDEILVLYPLSGETSYRKISWSLKAARCRFRLFQSLWNTAEMPIKFQSDTTIVHYTISLSSLCKLIWGHWFIKCLSDIFCRVCEQDKAYSLSYQLYNMWGCVFSFYPFPLLWLREYIYFVLLSSSNWKYELLPIV